MIFNAIKIYLQNNCKITQQILIPEIIVIFLFIFMYCYKIYYY